MKEDNTKRRWAPNDEQWLLFLRLLSIIGFTVSVCVCVTFVFYEFRAFNWNLFFLHWITVYTNLKSILLKIIKKIRCQLNSNFLIHQHFVSFLLCTNSYWCVIWKIRNEKKENSLSVSRISAAKCTKKIDILFVWISTFIIVLFVINVYSEYNFNTDCFIYKSNEFFINK